MRNEKGILENDKVEILGYFSIQTDESGHNKLYLILLEKKEICIIVAAACPFDPRIEMKEKYKLKNDTDLKFEILKM